MQEVKTDNPFKEQRSHPDTARILGHIVDCNGSRATIASTTGSRDQALAKELSVGKLITIKVGRSRIVALVYSMQCPSELWSETSGNTMHFQVELVGEIRDDDGDVLFNAGISDYPRLGDPAHNIRAEDLDAIYSVTGVNPIKIGHLSQNSDIAASISADALLNRHFAIVGTTGVGKSTAVSLIVNRVVEACPDLRVLILDPHNEFAAAFKEKAHLIDTEHLDLPFWLFRLEEFAEVIFRGRQTVVEEIDALRELIAEAKRDFRGASDSARVYRRADQSVITSDTPIPYRMADLLALIDERIGQLDRREEKPFLRSLKVRIQSAINDPRFHFMFSSNTIMDNISDILRDIFRIPGDGRPITSFQLSGIPSEVVNAVASVLCRLAFEIALWSNGAMRILVLCEEAHRYVPADKELGFYPTRQAVARIAKEGRKYGVGLGVVTQRPGELDPTILSQCSTVFAMRLANDHDQEIIRSAISNSSSSTTSFLSSIGNGEAIAFGEAVPVPMRMCFERLRRHDLPRTSSNNRKKFRGSRSSDGLPDIEFIVQQMRHTELPMSTTGMSPEMKASLQPALDSLRPFGAAGDETDDDEAPQPISPSLPEEPGKGAERPRSNSVRDFTFRPLRQRD